MTWQAITKRDDGWHVLGEYDSRKDADVRAEQQRVLAPGTWVVVVRVR